MEYWDIYDEKKQKTGRTMKRNDWNMQPDVTSRWQGHRVSIQTSIQYLH